MDYTEAQILVEIIKGDNPTWEVGDPDYCDDSEEGVQLYSITVRKDNEDVTTYYSHREYLGS